MSKELENTVETEETNVIVLDNVDEKEEKKSMKEKAAAFGKKALEIGKKVVVPLASAAGGFILGMALSKGSTDDEDYDEDYEEESDDEE